MTGQVVSMGCSGSAFFTFIEPPWRQTGKDGNARTISILGADTIRIHEDDQCASTGVAPPSSEESYRVRVCPRTVFRHADSGWDVDLTRCPVILDRGTGSAIASVPANVFER